MSQRNHSPFLVGHGPAAVAVCEAFGLTAGSVKSLHFTLQANEVAELVAVTHMREDFSSKMAEVTRRYALVHVGHAQSAVADVLNERRRQVEAEGYDPAHDDEHANDEIAALACYYAMPPAARDWSALDTGYGDTFGAAIIPAGWAVPGACDRRRELVKAAALILVEIERMDRAAEAAVCAYPSCQFSGCTKACEERSSK